VCGDTRSLGPPATRARRPLAGLAGAALATLLSGCGGPSAAVSAAENAAGSPVEVRAGHDYPSLSLVARDGDPFAAIAFAAAHDGGATISAWLGALIDERGRRALAHGVEVRPNGNGVVVRVRVDTPAQARQAVAFARDALSRPVTPAEFGRIAERVRANSPVRAFVSASERAAGECVGELGTARPGEKPSAPDFEKWRASIFSSESVAFAAVGRRAVLDAAAEALRDGAAWPDGNGPEDPWPVADVSGAYAVEGTGRTLSVALRVGDAARALEAAKALGARRSAISSHAVALDPSWSVDRVVATTRPRGACLRIDLRAKAGSATPLLSAAEVGALTLDEAARALEEAKGAVFSLDRPVLESWDPRNAAAIAAWHALSGRREQGPRRSVVSYAHPPSDTDGDARFPGLLARAATERRAASFDVRRQSEPGQGELWLLLASPCATATETTRSAGVSALAIRTLAATAMDVDGVHIEPWVSAEGIGLLSHGPRAFASESPARHAARVAAALGRALAGAQIGDEDVGLARTALQAELDPETEPLWPVVLEALSPKHPSLLDPRGTWQSITDLSTQAAEIERHAVLRGSLRLALLGPDAAARSGDALLELTRWLHPDRARNARCPALPPLAAHPGEYEVDAPAATAGARAVIAVTLPLGNTGGVPLEAEYTAYLLNRAGGWLERAVRAPGLAARAEATVLGGADAAALAIEVAAPGPTAKPAAAQIRALLSRLSDGTVTADELAQARAAYDEMHAAQQVDPRRRVVELWLARIAAKAPDLASLRAFHRQAFAAERHVIVLTRAR
jgi:hypothetical protein